MAAELSPVSLNGIMSNALSALHTNTSALDVVSSNISNVNTPNYAQRVVNEEAQVVGGQLAGVDIADIQRVTNQFLTQQTLAAQSSSSLYSAQNTILNQINALLGQVGSGTDLPSQLNDVFASLGTAALSPTTNTNQQAVLTALNKFAASVSALSSSISGVRNQADQQVMTDVGSVNGYLQQIYQLNQQIEAAQATGDTSSSLLDQRDQVMQSLSKLIGVSTTTTSNGAMLVSTTDGVNLVGNSTYAQLSCAGGATNGNYAPVMLQNLNALTGLPTGSSQSLNADLGSGEIAGLIQMRDGTLGDLQEDLGNFAQNVALGFNAQYNANVAFPAPTSLSGRDTGLLGTDGMNFTGQTTIAVTDASGNLVSRIDVDFDTGTLSVDGGAPASIGTSVSDFVTALNGALGANGTASFNNGQLSIAATGTNGVVIQDDSSDPSNRGGVSFSQYFGMNDLFQAAAPSISATGLSAADVGGFNNGTINLQINGPVGQPGPTASITLNSGMTISDIVNALNAGFGSAASFSLTSNGSLVMTPGAGYSGYTLGVLSDTTQRGTTGMSLSELFGLGKQQIINQAVNFSVNPIIADGQQPLAFGEPQMTASTTAGGMVIASGDSSGLLALQNLSSTQLTFPAAGGLNAETASLGNYADSFYQSIASLTQSVQQNTTASGDQLTEAQTRQSQVSGVSLDTELSNMVLYQQAYSAGARVLQTANQLFSTLLQIQPS
ncbi:MAG TPA: flagellar hook-associated protein FlgK [Rhizomicrobium sp.]|nr:flagellar hook-associated protein FlgK [Rhizomicrobium sp.]